ncbi:glycosyltransferase family 4 protein [Helicobacter suis]|uniref:glycosyltransferase family 4 protein n=1 Tax=Helicobacter suis TaxID=104628 RepID=UPI002492B086|nr:glycosyltransferase family 1 protein [Helicobacter suis]
MKKIVIDVTVLLEDLTGLGYYTLNLVQSLEKHFENRDDITIKLVAQDKLYNLAFFGSSAFFSGPVFFDSLTEFEQQHPLQDTNRVSEKLTQHAKPHILRRILGKIYRSVKKIIKESLLQGFYFLKYRYGMGFLFVKRCEALCNETFDLYIEPGFMTVPLRAKKILGAIHDLPLCDLQSWLMSKDDKARWEYYVQPRMSTYDSVVCFSEHVRADILKTFGFPNSKVHVIYHGLRDYKDTTPANLSPYLGEFILAVGAGSARKNVKRLVEAFQLLPQEIQQRYKVVFTGPGIKAGSCVGIEHCGIKPHSFIISLGYVSDSLLRTLYAHARVLWWGSLAEGFGWPMLEAMQAGCVVLASNVSCMPEILGDAGVYCDPYNVQDIAKQLEKALTDKELREQCIKNGLERVKKFDSHKNMQRHMEIIDEMLGFV